MSCRRALTTILTTTRSHVRQGCQSIMTDCRTNRPTSKPLASERTVWHVDQQGEQAGIHPTQKPVELFIRPIEFHTRPGDICYEPFSGSGTQLIAAERTGRLCYAMEMEPRYCDVAKARWEAFSGQKATRSAML